MGRSQIYPNPEDHPNLGSNANHSQTSGNLFPCQNLKGSHTFTTQSATVESNGAEKDSGMKAEEAKSLDGENPETSSGVGGVDHSVGYIVHFANMVELFWAW